MSSLKHEFTSELFFFAAAGGTYALLTSRLPAIKAAAGLTDSDIGVGLLCLGIASVTGLAFCGRFIQIFSSRRLLQIAALALFLEFPLAGLLTSKLALYLFFAFTGLAIAVLDVCMNTQALLLEIKHHGRFMGKLQSGYSFGCIFGALCGSAFAAMDAGPFVNFLFYGVLGLLGWLFARSHLNDDIKRQDTSAKKKGLPAFVYFCGLLEICAFAGEGTVGDWGSILLHTSKGAPEQVAALSFGVAALAMALVRLVSDKLRTVVGDAVLLGCGGIAAAAGLAIAALCASPYLCLAGFFLAGCGIAPVVPVIMSRAGSVPGVDPGAACSAVSTLGYGTLLFLPPVLGHVGDIVGLETAFLIPVALCLCLALGSRAFRGKQA